MKNLKNGFTLLEILTTISILVIISYFCLKIASLVLTNWANHSNKQNNEKEIKRTFNILEEDLEMAFPYFLIDNSQNEQKLSFYSNSKEDEIKKIIYEVGFNSECNAYGLFRFSENCENIEYYNINNSLLKINPSLSRVFNVENMIIKDIELFSINQINNPFNNSPIGIEIIIKTKNNEELSKTFVLITEPL